MSELLQWLQSTPVAAKIATTQMLTAALSSAHLVGLTLVVGSAWVSALRITGAVLPDRPAEEVIRPAGRGILIGLCVSISTGLLLFAARATAAGENPIFWLKMTLLVVAALAQTVIHRAVVRRSTIPRALRAAGVLGLALWAGVALAGCAFILLE
jgi:hypothetical protein